MENLPLVPSLARRGNGVNNYTKENENRTVFGM